MNFSHVLVIFGKSTEYSIAFEFAKLADMNFWKLRLLLRCRWWLLQLWSHRLIHMVGALFCSIWERHWDYWQCMFLNPPLWCLVKWFVFCVQELFFPSVCSFWRRDQSHALLSWKKICSKCLTFAGWECSTTTLSEPSTLRVFIDLDCFALLSHLSFRKESTNCFVFWIQSCVLSCETLVITGGAVMVRSRPIRWFQLYEHAGLFS